MYGIIPSNKSVTRVGEYTIGMEVFISYETTTGQSYASNLKKALERVGITAFVATEDIQKGTPDRKAIDNAINDCTYFAVIMTYPAILSKEVKREVELATKIGRHIIPCKPQTVDRALTNTLPLMGGLQQFDFESKEHLADQVVTEIVNRKKQEVAGRPIADEAAEVELSNVQAAVIAMMVDNNLTRLPNPVTVATSDMGAFPDTTVAASKGTDPNGNTYDANDKAGFILYQHDIIGGDASNSTGLVNYVATRTTKGTYTIDAQGTVTQVTTGYE